MKFLYIDGVCYTDIWHVVHLVWYFTAVLVMWCTCTCTTHLFLYLLFIGELECTNCWHDTWQHSTCMYVPCVHYLYVPPGTTPSRHMNVHRHNPCLTFNNSQSTYVFHFFASSGLPSVSNLCLFLKCRFKLLLFANFMPHPACLQWKGLIPLCFAVWACNELKWANFLPHLTPVLLSTHLQS